MIQQLAQIRSLKAEHMIPTVVCFHFPAPKFGREKHSLDRWVASRAGNMALKPLVPVVPWRSRAKAPWLALRPPGGLEAHSRSRGNLGRGTLGGGAGEGKQRVVHFVSRNSLFRVVTSTADSSRWGLAFVEQNGFQVVISSCGKRLFPSFLLG